MGPRTRYGSTAEELQPLREPQRKPGARRRRSLKPQARRLPRLQPLKFLCKGHTADGCRWYRGSQTRLPPADERGACPLGTLRAVGWWLFIVRGKGRRHAGRDAVASAAPLRCSRVRATLPALAACIASVEAVLLAPLWAHIPNKETRRTFDSACEQIRRSHLGGPCASAEARRSRSCA